MRFLACIAFGILAASCSEKKESQSRADAVVQPEPKLELSKQIVAEFPLMPHIEKMLWRELIAAELNKNTIEAEGIAAKMQGRHPFSADEKSIKLGGIIYHKDTKRIQIPARVSYPVAGDDRHPGELELILCSEKGRTHETLFVTECRPLHLELILHLAGYKTGSSFRVFALVADQPAISVEQLILLENKTHPEKLTWEFIGSAFQPLYQPDQTGDFIICWHAHDSVLKVTDLGIADGETKLQVKNHHKLKQGTTLMLELIPQG